jgi:hypothetical protein
MMKHMYYTHSDSMSCNARTRSLATSILKELNIYFLLASIVSSFIFSGVATLHILDGFSKPPLNFVSTLKTWECI